MTKPIARLAGTLALALTCSAFTGAALAGNGNGNDSGGAPGNSENAPGQQKKVDEPAPAQPAAQPAAPAPVGAPAEAAAPVRGKAAAPGQQKKATRPAAAPAHANAAAPRREPRTAAAPAASAPTSTPDWYNAQGKPKHNVPAIAATIPAASTGTGPGRSGKHKYTVCHNGHAITVDVHSAKAHVGRHGDTFLPFNTKGKAACGEAAAAASVRVVSGCSAGRPAPARARRSCTTAAPVGTAPAAAATPATAATPASSTALGASSVSTGATPASTGATPASTAGTHVLGERASITRPAASGGSGGGVLGVAQSLAATASAASLPFTGFPVWLVTLVALGLVAGGLAVRRAAAPA